MINEITHFDCQVLHLVQTQFNVFTSKYKVEHTISLHYKTSPFVLPDQSSSHSHHLSPVFTQTQYSSTSVYQNSSAVLH